MSLISRITHSSDELAMSIRRLNVFHTLRTIQPCDLPHYHEGTLDYYAVKFLVFFLVL